jgi:archaemetzincin
MKKSSGFLKSNPSHIEIEIFYSQVSLDEIQIIKNALMNTYKDILEVFIGGEIELISKAYSSKRDQYNANILLDYLLNNKKKRLGLWVISKDLYTLGMNFIFGLALDLNGAVLSIFRLSNKELIEKESIHEVGHVLGLNHCTNSCVMQYSNSLWEAKMKPIYLCNKCKQKIDIKKS